MYSFFIISLYHFHNCSPFPYLVWLSFIVSLFDVEIFDLLRSKLSTHAISHTRVGPTVQPTSVPGCVVKMTAQGLFRPDAPTQIDGISILYEKF